MFLFSSRQSCQRLLPLLLALLVSGSAAAEASAPRLTLHETLQIAQARSRALDAEQAAADAARELAIAAGELPDPTLRFGVDNLPVEGDQRWSLTDDFMTMRSVGVMQTFTRSAKREARSARYSAAAATADSARAMALAKLRRDAAQVWFARYYREALLSLYRQQRDEMQLQVDAVDAAYRGGRAPQSELFEARAALAQIDERITAAESAAANASIALMRWVGGRADAPLGARPDLTSLSHPEQHFTHQLDAHPDLQWLAQRELEARAEADVAKQERRADWSVELMYGKRGPDYADMVSLGVSVPLQWNRADRQDRKLAAKLAQAEQLRAERDEMARVHRVETAQWVQSWRGNLQRLATYEQSLIPLTQQRTHAALAGYRGGSEALTAVLAARRAEIEIRVDQLQLELETALLWSQLEFLFTEPLPNESLGANFSENQP